MTPVARIDPSFHPGEGTVALRICGDDGTETAIEWGWEQMLEHGASLIAHALAAKRLRNEPDWPLSLPRGSDD